MEMRIFKRHIQKMKMLFSQQVGHNQSFPPCKNKGVIIVAIVLKASI